jgi:hypothetical protein
MSNTETRFPLWSFNWIGGGYNQVRSETLEGVLEVVAKQFPSTSLRVSESTIREVKDEASFWANYPIFD